MSSLYMMETQTSSQNQPPRTPKNHQNQVKSSHKRGNLSINGSRKFIGVRQRSSGRWVAEIKVNQQKLRLWLGTFDTAEEAALAYDGAARLLRGTNSKTNFKTQENNCNVVLGNNPRLYHLLKHAIMKNIAKSSSLDGESSEIDAVFMSSQDKDKFLHLPRGSMGITTSSSTTTKVYSSVIVAPSFSDSLLTPIKES